MWQRRTIWVLILVGVAWCIWLIAGPDRRPRVAPEERSAAAAQQSVAAPASPAPSPAAAVAPPSSSPSAPSAPSATAIPAEMRQRLIGRWQRPDGGYILTIKEITEAGVVTALYNNPNPIKVSRAEAVNRDGQTLMAVELRDTGYPGNYYTLKYEPDSDQLVGIYTHLGINQQFDVNFVRLPKDGTKP